MSEIGINMREERERESERFSFSNFLKGNRLHRFSSGIENTEIVVIKEK